MIFGMAAYAIVRDSEAEAQGRGRAHHHGLAPPPGFANFDQWLKGTQLERELKLQEYSVSNRGLRPGLSAPRTRCASGSPPTKPPASTCCCCR